MLRISNNRRFLVHTDGSPFFFLADTGWTLLHRLGRDETIHYLSDRAAKGFTIIQVMGISEFDGLSVPNALGHLPFHGTDRAQPNEAYFRHVDWVVAQAVERGLHLALMPAWGDPKTIGSWCSTMSTGGFRRRARRPRDRRLPGPAPGWKGGCNGATTSERPGGPAASATHEGVLSDGNETVATRGLFPPAGAAGERVRLRPGDGVGPRPGTG
jgi:hypothetical protein